MYILLIIFIILMTIWFAVMSTRNLITHLCGDFHWKKIPNFSKRKIRDQVFGVCSGGYNFNNVCVRYPYAIISFTVLTNTSFSKGFII